VTSQRLFEQQNSPVRNDSVICWWRMSLPRQFARCEGVMLPLAVESRAITAPRPEIRQFRSSN
jgi:hypothetical protein